MFENAKWITAGKDFKECLPNFRKAFTAKGPIKKATAYMTAFGDPSGTMQRTRGVRYAVPEGYA